MSEVPIPPAPHWFRSLPIACPTDSTLVYAAKNDLIIVEENEGNPPLIKFINHAHKDFILSVSTNRKWGRPNSYCVSMGENATLKIWNVVTSTKVFVNQTLTERKEPPLGAVFAGEDRVISVATNGFAIVWNFMTNEVKLLNSLFKQKVVLTCLSSCPHAAWLVAFGLNNGCVVIADLKTEGQILYNLRGHFQPVVTLSWCPVPVNVFPKKPCNTVGVLDSPLRTTDSSDEKNSLGTSDADGDDALLPEGKTESDVTENNERARSSVTGFLHKTLTESETMSCILSSDKKPLSNSEIEIQFSETIDTNTVKCEILEKLDLLSDVNHAQGENIVVETDGEKASVVKDICKVISTSDFLSNGTEAALLQEKEPVDFATEVFSPGKNENENNWRARSSVTGFLDKALTTSENMPPISSSGKTLPSNCPIEVQFFETIDKNTVKCEALEKLGAYSDANHTQEKNVNVETDGVGTPILCESNSTADFYKYVKASEPNKVTSDLSGCSESELTEKSCEVEGSSIKYSKEIEEIPRLEYLLASSGRDGSVYIWRAGTDGRMQTFFNISNKCKKGRYKQRNSTLDWVSLCWISPNNLLTSTMNGEVLSWIVPKPQIGTNPHRLIHANHSSIIFNIVAPPKLWKSCNWHDQNDNLVFWSWGHDGKLLKYDLTAEKMTLSYTTLSSYVACIEALPQDPNRFAVACKDGTICLWDLSVSLTREVKLKKHFFKEIHKLSAISWHPLREMILGYGTEEGRVGYIDMNSRRHVLFTHYLNTNVYKVQWGPVAGNLDCTGLYVVAGGKLVVYEIDKPKKDPTETILPGNNDVYRFAWKPDYTVLLVNSRDGTLYVLNNKFLVINLAVISDKGFNDIVWHPESIGNSLRSNWFAAATPNGVVVYNCIEEQSAKESLLNRVIARFEGHIKPPVTLAWCPFQGNRIASIAMDGITHIWDIKTNALISTFVRSYVATGLALAWSPFNSDLILIGDKALSIWSIEKNPPLNDKALLSQPQVSRKKPVQKCTILQDGKETIIENFHPKIQNAIVSSFYTSSSEKFSYQVNEMKKLKNFVEGYHVWAESDCDPLQIFGNQEQVASLLKVNYDKQKVDRKFKFCDYIALWNGTAAKHIEDAIAENRVTETMITYAPMISLKLWQEACMSYANKLVESGICDPLEVVQYYLACHKVETAVEFLCSCSRFKEALALARRRFDSDSKITKDVTEKWAAFSIKIGNFETAAYCYISIGEYKKAARILSRRKNADFLKFALLELAGDDDKELSDSIFLKLTEISSQEAEPDNQSNETEPEGKKTASLQSGGDADIKSLEKEFNEELLLNENVVEEDYSNQDNSLNELFFSSG